MLSGNGGSHGRAEQGRVYDWTNKDTMASAGRHQWQNKIYSTDTHGGAAATNTGGLDEVVARSEGVWE